MIQLKILTKQKGEYFSISHLSEILGQMEKKLGYKIEKTDHYDHTFNGFYLMPNTNHYSSEGLISKENAKNIFLFGIVNSEISDVVNMYKPIGLVQWRLSTKNKRTLHLPNNMIKKYQFEPIIKFNYGYSMVGFTEFEGEENALASSIIKYLTLCSR